MTATLRPMEPDRTPLKGRLSHQEALPETVRKVLGSRVPRVIREGTKPGYRHAGVLLPLMREEGIWKVLFTRRSHRVQHHKGQISFPGGAVDKEDASIEKTVLRETCEEIGLSPDRIEILGRLDDVLTVASNYVVHPLVGRITLTENLVINRAEVAGLLKVPLGMFTGALKGLYPVEYEGTRYETTAYKCGQDTIWGATARILENFMEIVGDSLSLPPTEK